MTTHHLCNHVFFIVSCFANNVILNHDGSTSRQTYLHYLVLLLSVSVLFPLDQVLETNQLTSHHSDDVRVTVMVVVTPPLDSDRDYNRTPRVEFDLEGWVVASNKQETEREVCC